MRIAVTERPRLRVALNVSALGLTLIAATALRAWDLGRLSFWYDEVVTMRLAEAPSIAELFKLLFRIDATRAPLHPLILQDWLAVFGNSETAARSLSVVFGVATVFLLYVLGRLAFDESTGLWSAFLGALSPLLVYYSRETRMYALLTLITTVCWVLLFWNRRTPARWKPIAYAVCLVALLFTHPLGLLMLGTLGLASALDVRGFFGSWKAWLAVHLGVPIVAAPWLRFYFDHAPEFLTGRLPIKFLLATPIGFLGGDAAVYGLILALIAFGLYLRRIVDLTRIAVRLRTAVETGCREHPFSPRGRRCPEGADEGASKAVASPSSGRPGHLLPREGEGELQAASTTREWIAPACLILWLALPPTTLYVYSWIASPIFGPARYTVFCAPAYLVLVAQALSRFPPLSRWSVAFGLTFLTVGALSATLRAPPRRTDWRALEAEFAPGYKLRGKRNDPVVVVASDAEPNVEVETARYYLQKYVPVIPFDETQLDGMIRDGREIYVVTGWRPLIGLPPDLRARLEPYIGSAEWQNTWAKGGYGGLTAYRLNGPRRRGPRPPVAPAPAAPARPAPD